MTIRRPAVRHVRAAPNPGGPTPIWPPTRLPGCVAWYDMQETFEDTAGTVTKIRNMVSASDAMAEATNPPAWSASAINGRPAMTPDGSNDILISTEAAVVAAFSGVEKQLTITAVFSYPAVLTSNPTIVGAGNSASANALTHLAFTSGPAVPRISVTRKDDAAVTSAATPLGRLRSGLPYVASFAVDTRYVQLWLNGKPEPQSNTTNFNVTGQLTPDRVALCAQPGSTPGNFANQSIGAVIIHTGVLPSAAIRGLQAALMGRWGIPSS